MTWLERWIRELLRVPAEPEPPIGQDLATFRADRGYFRYLLAGWLLRQLGTVIGLTFGVILVRQWGADLPVIGPFLMPLEALAILFFLIQLPISYLLVDLEYRYRWYMVTDRSLRIREGIMAVHEKTMTFSNVQNLTVRQGPLQRLFGIADLEVRSAGGGDQQGPKGPAALDKQLHIGYFRGVGDAAGIRDTVLGRLRGSRDAGLGDPDDHRMPLASEPTGPGRLEAAEVSPLLAASRELLVEARALRASLLRT